MNTNRLATTTPTPRCRSRIASSWSQTSLPTSLRRVPAGWRASPPQAHGAASTRSSRSTRPNPCRRTSASPISKSTLPCSRSRMACTRGAATRNFPNGRSRSSNRHRTRCSRKSSSASARRPRRPSGWRCPSTAWHPRKRSGGRGARPARCSHRLDRPVPRSCNTSSSARARASMR